MTFLGPARQNRRLPRLRLPRALALPLGAVPARTTVEQVSNIAQTRRRNEHVDAENRGLNAGRPSPPSAGIVLAAGLLVPALMLHAGAAQAQTSSILVSNTELASNSGSHTDVRWDMAQAFTTGGSSFGYTLTHMDLVVAKTSDSEPLPTYSVSIHSESSGNPGTSLGTLTNPASLHRTCVSGSLGVRHSEFEAPASGIDLAADTTYFVVVDATGGTEHTRWCETTSTGEEGSSAEGWSIANQHHTRSNNTGNWFTSSGPRRIRVRGYAKAAPPVQPPPPPDPDRASVRSATVDGLHLKVTFDKALRESSVPAPAAFEVRAGGERHDVDTVGIERAVLTLTLVHPVDLERAVTLTYRYQAGSRPLTDVDGIRVAYFFGLPVQPTTPTPAMPFAAVVVLALLLARRSWRGLAP